MSVIKSIRKRMPRRRRKSITYIYGSSDNILTKNVVIKVNFKKIVLNYRIVIFLLIKCSS